MGAGWGGSCVEKGEGMGRQWRGDLSRGQDGGMEGYLDIRACWCVVWILGMESSLRVRCWIQ